MKVVYEPGEIERIKESYDYIHGNDVRCPLFKDDPDRVYALTFKVTNLTLAEYILASLLNDKLEDFEMGIDIQSIEFSPLSASTRNELKEQLHKMIDELV